MPGVAGGGAPASGLAVSSVLVGRLTKLDEIADGREVRRSLTATAGRPPPLSGGLLYQTYDTTSSTTSTNNYILQGLALVALGIVLGEAP